MDKIKSKDFLLSLGALTVAILLFVGVFSGLKVDIAKGSVSQGSEYNSTTTISTSAGTHWLAKSTTYSSVCVLGSIIVASSSGTSLTLWNATSTTDIASTTITTLKASVGEGTYTYDITCSRGIIVETPSNFNGSYTVTYR